MYSIFLTFGFVNNFNLDIRQMTNNRKKLICQAASDIDSGNHLLYPRTIQQRGIMSQILKIIHKIKYDKYGRNLTIKQRKMYIEYLMDSNYDYAMNYKKQNYGKERTSKTGF